MRSKFFFEEFKKEIADDHKKFKSHLETREIPTERCNHKDKVKIVNGMLRCPCGAAWSGPQLETLLDLLNK